VRRSGRRRIALAGAGAGLLLGGAACSPAFDMLHPVTPQGQAIAALFNLALALSALILTLVVGLLLGAIWRYRARPDAPEPPQVHGNRNLEIFWTATPVLLLTVLFFLTLRTMNAVEATEPGGLRVQVIGWQWWWEYRYPDLGVVTANELHVPVGTPLALELTGGDVIHSFWVPRLTGKRDAVPGKWNTLRLQVQQAGTYDGACTEFCGMQHAWMRIRVVADPPDQFDAWVRAQRQPAAQPNDPQRARGQQVFLQNTCVNCHTIAGTPATARVGPDLTHFGGRTTLGAGVRTNTPEHLREWVQHVQGVKPGALMPNFDGLPAADLDALVAYLEGLK
jgi:cytochrome c oxidase subunit II